MNLKYSFYFIVPLLMAICLLTLFSAQPKIDYKDYAVTSELLHYTVYQDISSQKIKNRNSKILFLGNSYVAFKEAIAFKESQGKYGAVNTLGYLGKYQFGITTLELLGIYNPEFFLKNPALQEKAFLVNTKRNKWVLRRDIKRFVGKKIDGIRITESGILGSRSFSRTRKCKALFKKLRSLGFYRCLWD